MRYIIPANKQDYEAYCYCGDKCNPRCGTKGK